MKRLFLFVIVLVCLGAFSGWFYAQRALPLPDVPFEFSIKQGSSLTVAAADMQQAGLLGYSMPFVVLGRIMGKASQLKAGNYQLVRPVTPLELLDILSKGDTSNSQISIIEGWNFRQLRAALNANKDLKHDTQHLSDNEILRLLNATEGHPEGLFFPDTYYFAVGSSDTTVLKRAYATMQKRLQEAWDARDNNLPLKTPYQALILASIVEKETGSAADRSKISAVFINRLNKGMMLQTDPTVIYGIGPAFDGNLRKQDLLTDTPYNTYTRFGLPVTPIALPGAAALHAALHPAQSDALYFVARGDGTSQFSNNLDAHNRAVNQYQK